MEKKCHENFTMTLEEDIDPIDQLQKSKIDGCTKNDGGLDNNRVSTFELQDYDNMPTGKPVSLTFRNKLYSLSRNLFFWNFILPVLFHMSVFAFVVLAVAHWLRQDKKPPLLPYDGLGLLLVIVFLSYWSLVYYRYLKPYYVIRRDRLFQQSKAALTVEGEVDSTEWFCCSISCLQRWLLILLYIVPLLIFVYAIGEDAIEDPTRLRSLIGLFLIIFFGYLFSKHPTHINWRIVFRGLLLQIIMALCTVRWKTGMLFFQNIGNKIETFLSFSYVGAAFVYSDNLIYKQTVFAFQCLSVIFFVNFMVEILFYYTILQRMFRTLGWFLQKAMGTTIIESVNCCVSVFLGMSEAMLMIKPYLASLTQSELQAVLLGELSTVAGSVFAAYTSFGVSPGYLVTASVMSAPAALSFSKLVYPETEVSTLTSDSFKVLNEHKNKYNSALSAGCEGAIAAVSIVASVIATLIAFISLVALGDFVISWLAALIGYENVTLVWLLGLAFTPIAFIIGVDASQSNLVGELIATKVIINEFVAYEKLGEFKKQLLLSSRSEAIATYALCSFSNPGSVASALAMISAICPAQLQNATKLAYRAYIGGIVTCFMTACVAGLLIPIDSSNYSTQMMFNSTLNVTS